MKFLKSITIIAILAAVLIAIFKFVVPSGSPSADNLTGFTISFVDEMKAINQFSTYMYHRSFFLDSKDLEDTGSKNKNKGRIIRKYDGLITAGYNFKKFDNKNVTIYFDAADNKCIRIKLPEVEILRCELNPKDRKDIVTLGYDDEQKEANAIRERLDKKASEELKKGAIAEGLLTSAKKNGKGEVEVILKAMGFKKIDFIN